MRHRIGTDSAQTRAPFAGIVASKGGGSEPSPNGGGERAADMAEGGTA
jgi:hypothetical protein